MNLETYLFWGLIFFFAIGGLRMKFIEAFCLAISSTVSLYLGFWQVKHYSALVDLIPRDFAEYVDYANPCLFVLLFFLSFFLLRIITGRANTLYEKSVGELAGGEDMIFSVWLRRIMTVICNAMTGVAMTTMIFLVVAVLPLAAQFPQISVKKVASLGSGGMSFVSAVVDTVSLRPWKLKEKSALMHFYLNSEEMDAEEALKKMQGR